MAVGTYNTRSPKAPYDADEDKSKPEYPYVYAESDILGATKMVYADQNNYEKSFSEVVRHDASFKINQTGDDKKLGLSNSFDHHTRNYAGGGTASTSDGHQDRGAYNENASSISNFSGDQGHAAGGTQYKGAGEGDVGGSKSGGFSNDNGDTYKTTTGNRISEHTGSTSTHHEGDNSATTTGNKYTMVKGEMGIHVQGGHNMDMQVDSGKFRVKSGMKLTIESGVEIEIKVGSNIITIDSSGIVINAAGGIVNIKSSSEVKLQDGGVIAPPTTFTKG